MINFLPIQNISVFLDTTAVATCALSPRLVPPDGEFAVRRSRRDVASMERAELEDKYLSLAEENLVRVEGTGSACALYAALMH